MRPIAPALMLGHCLPLSRATPWRSLRIAVALFVALPIAPAAHATNYSWNSGGTFVTNPGSWTPSGVPGTTDTATFTQSGNYSVLFNQNLSVSAAIVAAGEVTFASVSDQTLSIQDNANSTLSLPNANGGTTLTLGDSGGPIALISHNLDLENDAATYVLYKSTLYIQDFGSKNALINGTLLVSGSGSIFQKGDSQGLHTPTYVGTNGGSGILGFQNGSTGNKIFAPLLIADDLTSGTGEVDIGGFGAGAALSLADNLTMATHNMAGHTATMYIDSTNSALTQTTDQFTGPTGIYVGSPANGSAAIYVATAVSGGTLSSGPAGITINKTGSVVVGSGSTTGTLNANGDVAVDGGLLQVFSGSPFNFAFGKTLHIKGGGTADFQSFNINGSSIDFVAGSLSYAGNLLVGTGGPLGANLTLDNTRQLSLTGAISIDNTRTLALTGGAIHSGSLTNNGTLSLSTGTFNTGTASFANGSPLASSLAITISGTTRFTQYGALVASGAVSLGGSLIVTLNNFTPAIGNTFDILDGSAIGTFAGMQLPALPAGMAWSTSALYTTGVLSVVAAAGVPGDYNGNGIVDAADYTVWRDHLGQTFALPNRSVANTGPIAAADFTFWKSQFGQHAGSGSAAAVPEPATLWLCLMGTLAMYCRRGPKVP